MSYKTVGSLEQSLFDYLSDKEMLIIFDNFEHLKRAADFLSRLLAAAPGLRLLVTSRALVHIYGEHEFIVPPMHLPKTNSYIKENETEAIRLFCERARAIQPDFSLTSESFPIVAEICRRLDGLPLAIELAAARIRIFTPQELLQRLDRRLSILAQGPTDLPLHTRALESAISWSYDLLSQAERNLLNRLAVFKGSFTIQAVEAICVFPYEAIDPITNCLSPQPIPDIPLGLSLLIDQSLIMRYKSGAAATETRFYLLETIREFALGQLDNFAELVNLHRRHAQYYATWAEQIQENLSYIGQANWLTSIELEADNLQSAMGFYTSTGDTQNAARIARVLSFWAK